jgi:hypothetical protein
MKKNSLTTAVVAGLAGVAGLANVSNAVNINPDGLGQVLIYPYYTVEGGNSTLMSVINTTDEVKGVKVRFVESLNSREVLDFNLYLSEFDVWTGAVISTADDAPARLVTNDRSCTVPAIPAGGVDFRNYEYTRPGFNDDGPNGLERTREGHMEIIEMGVVDELVSATVTGFEAAAVHQANGIPLNCPRLVGAWTGGTWAQAPTATTGPQIDFRGPTGGLFGGAVIADVANGTALSYNADAIDGFYLLGDAALHFRPGSTRPALFDAQTALGEADSIVFDNGALITLDWAANRPDAVSSVFMHDSIYNEYNTSETTLAASEWVITFPTKRLHIEAATAADRLPFANDSDDSQPGTDNLEFDTSGYCEPIAISFYDREEGTPGDAAPVIDFSPEPPIDVPPGTNLCYEANIITFNQVEEVTAGSSAVLGSQNAFNVQLADIDGTLFTEGWIAMGIGDADNYMVDLGASGLGDTTGVEFRNQLFGLPVTGFWAANFVNANAAPGTLANYSVIAKHRASRNSRTVTVTGTTITGTGFIAS